MLCSGVKSHFGYLCSSTLHCVFPSPCVRACACARVCVCIVNRRSLQGLPVWVDSRIYRENNRKAKGIVRIQSHLFCCSLLLSRNCAFNVNILKRMFFCFCFFLLLHPCFWHVPVIICPFYL